MTRSWMFLSIFLAGCVSSGTHDAVLQELAAARSHGDEVSAELAEMERQNQELAAEKARLEQALAKETTEKTQLLQDQSALRASVEEMENALRELNRRKQESDARIAEYRGLLSRFQKMIDAGKLRVKIVEGRMVVELPTDVLFRSGQATLSQDGLDAIAEVTRVLAEIPERKFQVEGHTDNVPIATAQYPSNWELAAARALRVVHTMIEAGMPPQRISAASYGEFAPFMSNDINEGRDANRRIEIVVVPDMSSLPGFEELNRFSRAE